MQTVLIVIHLMIVLALVAVVLLQRSEGGGLGIGGGGNMMAARASGNPLTKITGILAFAFFVTSLSLGILARYEEGPTSILDQIEAQTEGDGQGILDQLGGAPLPETETTEDGDADVPAVPTGGEQAPAGNAGETETEAPAESAPEAAAPAEEPAPVEQGVPTGQ
jgi:preprotein translocase subunit SecG